MSKLIVSTFTISLDGYAAGVGQRQDAPFGDGADGLHDWMTNTRAFHETHGLEGGVESADDKWVRGAVGHFGATIMGRNMFSASRGPWEDLSWTGWWGDNPPYHNDVFVMTHHPRPSFELEGGNAFHFVDGSPAEVLELARAAADGKDVHLAGGAATLRQYLAAGLVDDMRLAISPVLVGAGERLFDGLDTLPSHYRVAEQVSTAAATHVHIVRR
ncbi:MAG: dihydrofolate reductase [Thermoactinospora sp.]|nr:dihydrofolate reductase [Thermoactinospora sp.]